METNATIGIARHPADPAPARVIRIGCPTRNTWQEDPVPADAAADVAFRTTIAVLARAEWLREGGRRTVEAWDETDPAMPTLLVAWPGTYDRGTYDALCVLLGNPMERGWWFAATGPAPELASPEGVAAYRRMQRSLLRQQARNRRGPYSADAVTAIDALAAEVLAGRTAATA